MFELYLYQERNGIKDHMIGVDADNLETYEESIEDVIAQDLIENICHYYTNYTKPGYVEEKITVTQLIDDFDI